MTFLFWVNAHQYLPEDKLASRMISQEEKRGPHYQTLSDGFLPPSSVSVTELSTISGKSDSKAATFPTPQFDGQNRV